ncbi:MAG: hypothetical protein KAS12_06160 [Candidatus Aenigmarchaeota archaeon]|nr:hypothetical protein [Candidatus Aenigmarchaeota archaeon]
MSTEIKKKVFIGMKGDNFFKPKGMTETFIIDVIQPALLITNVFTMSPFIQDGKQIFDLSLLHAGVKRKLNSDAASYFTMAQLTKLVNFNNIDSTKIIFPSGRNQSYTLEQTYHEMYTTENGVKKKIEF